MTTTPPYTVEVGDGRMIRCEGVCKQVIFQVQGLEIQQDFFIFGLGEAISCWEWSGWQDWEIKANFKDLTLKVPTPNGKQILKGELAMSRSAASFKTVIKA